MAKEFLAAMEAPEPMILDGAKQVDTLKTPSIAI